MTGKDRAALRAEAHHLVKIQLARTTEVPAKDAVNALATEAAAEVIQVIGRTATLYRRNPDIKGKPGDPPPWRR